MKTYSYTEHPDTSPKQRAWTRVLFILMGLGLVLFCLVNFMVFYPAVRDRNQTNAEVLHLASIKTNISKLVAKKKGSYGDLNQANANQARVFPVTMNDGDYSPNAKVLSSWGEPVRLRGIADGSTMGTYVIEYHAVPAGICLGLVFGSANTFEQIRVDGSPVFANDAGKAAAASEGGRFDPGKAAGACSDTDTPPLVEFVGR